MAILDITIDLGGDSLKLAYGYKDANGKLVLGKLSERGHMTQIGIPAVALYRRKQKEWLYGYEVENSGEQDFTTIVRIKNLFMLCAKKVGETEAETERLAKISVSNQAFYKGKRLFPKFYLPSERKSMEDFAEAVNAGMTFEANCTPKEVCEGYFQYVKTLIEQQVAELQKRTGMDFSPRYSVVYPPKVGANYKEEFKSVIKGTFGSTVHRELGTTRALGIYASQSKLANGRAMIADGETALVFDIGEEYISTVQISRRGDDIIVDGATGHKKAKPLGGVLVDEAIYHYLESGVEDRPAFASAGDKMVEGCPEAKKYQLLKDIKTLKNVLSSDKLMALGMYPKGVDIVIPREFHIQKSVTADALKTCIGVMGVPSTDGAAKTVAEKIYAFIKEEAEAPVNYEANKIIIAGGVIETLGLGDYIAKRLKSELGKTVLTFDAEQEASRGQFKIYANESSVYAAALGMTIASVNNTKVSTVLSLSYGSWSWGKYEVGNPYVRYIPRSSDPEKQFRSFSPFPKAERGAVLKEVGETIFESPYNCNTIRANFWQETVVDDEEMFSCVLNRAGMDRRKDDKVRVGKGIVSYVKAGSKTQLAIGAPPQETGGKPDIVREVAMKHFGLKQVFFDNIYIYDSANKRTRRRIRLQSVVGDVERQLRMVLGIKVTKNGIVTPFVKNDTKGYFVKAEYFDPATRSWKYLSSKLKIENVYFDFKEGKSFTAEVSDDD